MQKQLGIIGASVRAAAQSAQRAGFKPFGADLFGDADLPAEGRFARIDAYQNNYEKVSGTFFEYGEPESPWIYTGALENHPELLELLVRPRPLWGNSAEVVRRVRDPQRVFAVLTGRGFSVPAVRLDSACPPENGTWLRKPLRSAGGARIEPWTVSKKVPDTFLQERIEGQPIAAIFCAGAGQAALLGVTTQLLGDDQSGQPWCTASWTHARGYQYAGSIGPLALAPPLRERIAALGNCLAQEFGLVGLFGVDAVLAATDVWPVEINPRYTASVELLERAIGFSSIALHAIACQALQVSIPPSKFSEKVECPLFGKAIVFAPHEIVIPSGFVRWARESNAQVHWPWIADIPQDGSTIAAGHPVATVFAEGETFVDIVKNLHAAAKRLLDQLTEVESAADCP